MRGARLAAPMLLVASAWTAPTPAQIQIHATPPGVVNGVVAQPATNALQLANAPQPAAAPAGGPLPKAIDRPAGEDGFEVVLLKYADVSEVVGLLTEGLTVKSNDGVRPAGAGVRFRRNGRSSHLRARADAGRPAYGRARWASPSTTRSPSTGG